ncbi:MAG: hypothetical protein AAFR58_01530 [Cyanobacteria bacterium J06627_28]
MAIFDPPLLALPWVALPDSLDTLGTFASQLQALISAALAHPFWAIGLLLLGIGLLQLIADLVKRVLKASLTFIVTLPLTLSQWAWKRATTPATSKADQINQLLTRLDNLRAEQDQVIDELKTLMDSTPKTAQDTTPSRNLEGSSGDLAEPLSLES